MKRLFFRLFSLSGLLFLAFSPVRPRAVVAGPVPTAQPTLNNYVFRRSWGSDAWGFGQMKGVAVRTNGDIYATSSGNLILQVNPTERTLTVWGGPGTGNGQFNNPLGIAVDSAGNVYVADTGNNRIQKFTSTGTYVTQWGGQGSNIGQFNQPRGIAVDSAGNVYVADTGNNRIQKFTSTGTPIILWGSYGSSNGQFSSPNGVAVSMFSIYVTDGYNSRVQIFSHTGTYQGQWGQWGYGNGEFEFPHGVVVDNAGRVYVTDTSTGRVQKFNSTGGYLGQWGTLGMGVGADSAGNIYLAGDTDRQRVTKFTNTGTYLYHWGKSGPVFDPAGLTVGSSGNIFVTDPGNYRVQKYTNAGTLLLQWGSQGTGNGQFDWPLDLEQDSNGNVYVLDRTRVQKFDSSGTYLSQWGGLNEARGIGIDSNDNVYISEFYYNQIRKFSSTGSSLTQWGTSGSGNGQLSFPYGVMVDGADNVYVADMSNRRIQKFTNTGTFLSLWGSQGTGNSQFQSPRGLAHDAGNNVYVTDLENYRVQKFTDAGAYLTQWGTLGYRGNQFSQISRVAVDANGEVYVSDAGTHRVSVFSDGYPTPDPTGGLVFNGSFEADPALTQWAYGGTLSATRTSTYATTGNYALLLGGTLQPQIPGETTGWAAQTFYVVPTWNRPMLSFAYRLVVNDALANADFFVALQNGIGLSHLATVLRAGYQPCGTNTLPTPDQDLGWRIKTYDLSAYKGQSLRLVFSSRNLTPSARGIWTYVDNVQVLDAGPQPTPAGPTRAYLPVVNAPSCSEVDPLPAGPEYLSP